MDAAGARDRRIGLLAAFAGFAMLSLGDAVIKTMAGDWPPTAISASRFLLGSIVLGGIVGAKGGRAAFVVPRPWLQLLRGVSMGAASLFFFFGVQLLPLADATSIQFTSPILTALLSTVFLRERVSGASWIAIAIALGGVLVVLRPNIALFGAAALLPLAGALCMASLMISNRLAAGLAPALTLQFLVTLFGTGPLIAAAFLLDATGMPELALSFPSWITVAKVAFVTMTGTCGHLLIFHATTRASAATIAPMVYAQFLVAITLGWLWFGNRPDAWVLIGAALIIGSGLWLFTVQRPRANIDTEAGGVPD